MNYDLCFSCYKKNCREYNQYMVILQRKYQRNYRESNFKHQHAVYSFNVFFKAWLLNICDKASPFIPCHNGRMFTTEEREKYELSKISAPFVYHDIVNGWIDYYPCVLPPERCPYVLEHAVCIEEETELCGKMER